MPDPNIDDSHHGKPVCDLCGKDDGEVNIMVGGPYFALHASCREIGLRAIRMWAHYIVSHPYGFQSFVRMMNSEMSSGDVSK
jgi:hypothetical protein